MNNEPTCINLKYIDHAMLLPEYEHGHIVEIIGRRTLHGPALVLRIPFDAYCNNIQDQLVKIAKKDAENANLRHLMLTGQDDIPF